MKEVRYTKYEAEDGTEFESKEECYNHELGIKIRNIVFRDTDMNYYDGYLTEQDVTEIIIAYKQQLVELLSKEV